MSMPLALAAGCLLSAVLSASDAGRLRPDLVRSISQQAAPVAVAPVTITDQEIEQFLLNAKIGKPKGVSKGITGTTKVTMTDGKLTHDAQIQTIDETKAKFESMSGTEFNFRDSWKYNVAAYRLDRLIGMNMVPVSVARRSGSLMGAFTWWLDDVLMEEGERYKKKIESPDASLWNEQMRLVRVFDQLIYNIDRNGGNLIITKDWRIWAIDHTRAFRLHHQLQTPANVTFCDRQVFEKMKKLDRATLDKALREFLTGFEIEGILFRRDLIVKMIEAKGPNALYDRHPMPALTLKVPTSVGP
jgi:hypothetical protein